VGMEHLAMWYVDCPDLVHEMSEFVGDFILRLIERALDEIPDLDFAVLWEDMCHKTGPLISPQWFRDFHIEPLKRVTKAVREAGIDVLMLDSDGRVDLMLPLWLEAGVNMHYPLEVASDCDPLHYRDLYGKNIVLMGGIDKRVLRDGYTKADVEREVLSKVPALWQQGGFSPMVDHAVPPDVPLDNFRHYIDLVQDICRNP
jgi:uroporphyrinogen-III decarboxylase